MSKRRRERSETLFPEALLDLMMERSMTFRALAAECGLSAGYLNHLSHGKRPVPDDETLWTIGAALGVRGDYFLEYRIRAVAAGLELDAALADRLYRKLSRPGASDEVAAAEDEVERLSVEDIARVG